MRGLKDKVVIVTGAARGIGRAVALRLHEEGAHVAIADSNQEGVESVAAEIRELGGRAEPVVLDVTSRESWTAAVQQVLTGLGRIDGLVNNAGVTRDSSLLKMTDEDWQLAVDVSLRGAWLGCQLTIPHMKERGGAIVNLSSESRWGAFGQANYAAAKAGLVGLTRTVAIEHGRHNIRSNAVAPGATLTPMVEAVPDHIRAEWRKAIPLKREAQPPEIAAAIVFLLSDDASYVSGAVLGVNGGSAV